MKPITHEELFLDAIVNGSTPPTPVTRIEKYLGRLAGESVAIPSRAETRIEIFLSFLCGENAELPEPQTRIEQYLAKLSGLDIEIPAPITRAEMYLAEVIENHLIGLDFNYLNFANLRF